MRLHDFIQAHKESILQEWEQFARTIEPAAGMDVAALRDHASLILDAIGAQLDVHESPEQTRLKSWGAAAPGRFETDAERHATDRLKAGFNVDQLVAEYRALRASVLKLWAAAGEAARSTDPQDIQRFNEGIDQALAESVAQFSRLLAESELKFRTVANAMPQMIWSTLPDGSHDYFNDQWYEFTGVAEGETDGQGWSALFHPDDQERAKQRWSQSLETGEVYEIEYRLRHRSGGYRWTLGRALPIRSKGGQIVRWMGTCTDIHAQKLAEDNLKASNRRKDEFLAMLAHELRNPLAPLRTAADLLAMQGVDAATVNYTGSIINRQVGHMTRLIDDLLDVSRVTRGTVELNSEVLDVRAAVDAAIEQAGPVIDARRHQLIVRVDAGQAQVRADRIRLAQVIANLLINAAKYTPPGGEITVTLEVTGPSAVLRVADNGSGIDPQLLPHVFELFTQGERRLHRSEGGLGLGLALVKSLVELHQGSVSVVSKPGQGSVFTVVLPLHVSAPANAGVPGSAQAALPGGGGLRIVLVDDNVDAAEMLAIRLRVDGHAVSVFHDSLSALARSRDAAVDVFILDIGLPDLDGYLLARLLREQPAGQGATFIALTGYGQPQDREKSQAAGFHHHLLKPVQAQQLVRLLEHVG